MADDDNKPAADDAEGGKGGGLGPILALALVLAVGVGVGFAINSLVQTDEDAAEEIVRGEDLGPLWERAKPLNMGDIVANVQGESGRRFAKVTVQLWVHAEDEIELQREELRPIMREVLTDKLRSYKLSELEADNAPDSLRRNFKEDLNRKLRQVFGMADDPDRTFITDIVLDGFLIQ
ncbi:MAG: flagellar basal body-associated FliL family protein [Planctomycetota bacterium]|jgi:flagellar basal body-associated protein FliL